MTIQVKYKKIYTSKENFENLRSDFRFARLLRLARVCNALNFCFQAYPDYKDENTPTGFRQQFNSSFFLAGSLYEGLLVLDNLKAHFGDRDSFHDGFGELLDETEIKDFRENLLKDARDRYIFHYDKDVPTKVLKTLKLDAYLFATAEGSQMNGIYYNLADEIAANYLTKDIESENDEQIFMKNYLKNLANISTKFIECADKLISDVLSEMDWKFSEGK